eukprot:521738-Rhodomonas_salina.1
MEHFAELVPARARLRAAVSGADAEAQVMETNARMNLTSAASYQELYSRHIADSLSLLPFFARSSAASSSSFPSSSSSSGSSSHGAGSASSVEEEAARARGGGGGGGGGRVRVLDVGTGGGLPGHVPYLSTPALHHPRYPHSL